MGLLSWLGIGAKHSDFDHQASELEATLPADVAGRPLLKWSVSGSEFWRAAGRKPASVTEQLDELGLSPNDIQMAMAGRADTRIDPPYIVWAVRFGPLTGDALRRPLPASLAMAVSRVNPSSGSAFQERLIADRQVMVGNREMVQQNNHHRGLPYLYFTHAATFGVIADDNIWAAEAISKLPPMRDSA